MPLHSSFLHRFSKCIRMSRIKDLIACHDRHKVFRLTQVDDIVCPARDECSKNLSTIINEFKNVDSKATQDLK